MCGGQYFAYSSTLFVISNCIFYSASSYISLSLHTVPRSLVKQGRLATII
jgi:hypothetical protein